MKSYSKKKLIKKFDPHGAGQLGKLFGLPFDVETSEIVVIPVPWDVTTPFNEGTSLAPKAVLSTSRQVELFLKRIPEAWKLGLCMLATSDDWILKNNQARKYTVEYQKFLNGEEVKLSEKGVELILQNINILSRKINSWVYTKSKELLETGKIPVVLGGDHSSPYGLIKAISKHYKEFGILQIDAFPDLKPFHQGFEFSYGSIMHNVLLFENVTNLVQVGIRELNEQEFNTIENDSRITSFYDASLAKERFDGVSWSVQVKKIIDSLPDNIYISIDVNGLERNYFSNTINIIPGGLSYNQLIYLLEKLMDSGKKIISFDICEISVNNDNIDAIVGSRILYNLANITAVTQKLLTSVNF